METGPLVQLIIQFRNCLPMRDNREAILGHFSRLLLSSFDKPIRSNCKYYVIYCKIMTQDLHFPAATNQNGSIIKSNCHMFSETKRVSTCPYQLTIFGLLMIGQFRQ